MTEQRIRHWRALIELEPFLLKALNSCPFISSVGAALKEITSVISDDDVALFVCYDPKPIAMALVRDNTGAFMPGVHVTHIYNEGNHEARRALTEAINYFALERGAEMVWGTDINQRPKAYERLFRIWKPKRRGIMYCYKPVKNDYNFESSFSS